MRICLKRQHQEDPNLEYYVLLFLIIITPFSLKNGTDTITFWGIHNQTEYPNKIFTLEERLEK